MIIAFTRILKVLRINATKKNKLNEIKKSDKIPPPPLTAHQFSQTNKQLPVPGHLRDVEIGVVRQDLDQR